VALNRGNVADSLMILLLVLAADATSRALLSGRLRWLLAAAAWVGLAFQAKMTVAWLVLPALAVAYLTVAVSLSWMTVVSLVPAHERPYVDGTQDNSLFSQVFDYNGIARLRRGNVYAGAGHPARFLVELSEASAAPAHRSPPGWQRLLSGVFGRDDGWLLPAAAIAAGAVLFERRRARRTDPLRACVLLWGTWLAVMLVFFSAGGYPNSYYVAALAPAIAALCATGFAEVWRRREVYTPAAALVLGVGYGVYLLRGGTGVPSWLVPAALCAGVLGTASLLLSARRRLRSERRSHGAVRLRYASGARAVTIQVEALARTAPSSPTNSPSPSRSAASTCPCRCVARSPARRRISPAGPSALARSIASCTSLPTRIGMSQRRSATSSKPACASTSLVVSAFAIENGPGPHVGSSYSSGRCTIASTIVCARYIQSLSVRVRHTTITRAPPGIRARRTLRRATTGLAKNIVPKRENARS
jgi:hypothetical protein